MPVSNPSVSPWTPMTIFSIKSLFIVGLLAINNVQIGQSSRARRPRGKAYSDWSLECQLERSLAGIRTRLYESPENGTDIFIYAFCRSVKHSSDPELSISESDCRETEEFEFGGEGVAEESGCKEGEYLNGILSTYAEGKRKMKLKCCKPQNTEIDEYVGCNVEGPLPALEQAYGYIKSPYDPVKGCPRDSITGITIANGQVTFKYCPLRVEGQSYLAICPYIKTGVDKKSLFEPEEPTTTTTVAAPGTTTEGPAPTTPPPAPTPPPGPVYDGNSLDRMIRLRPNKWSGVHESFVFECKGMKVVKHIQLGFQYHKDGVRQDFLVRSDCQPLFPDECIQKAKKSRVTKWTTLGSKDITEYGCKDSELLTGFASQFNEDLNVREMALICSEHSNVKVEPAGAPRRKLLVWGRIATVAPPKAKLLQNLAFDLSRVGKAYMKATSVACECSAEPEFETSTRFSENTGLSLDPWDVPIDVELPPNSLPKVEPGTMTEAKASFRTECPEFEIVSILATKFTEDGDMQVKIECKPQLEEEQSERIIRWTRWISVSGWPIEKSCRDNEALKGLMSYYDEKTEQRVVSIICMEGSNADKSDPKTETAEVKLDEEMMSEAPGEEYFIASFAKQEEIFYEYALYELNEDAKFDDSYIINEIEGVMTPMLEATPDSMSPRVSDGEMSTAGSDWKFECNGFQAVNSVMARNVIFDDGSDDTEMAFTCTDAVADAQTATAARWTLWSEWTNMRTKLGCKDDEILQGIASHFDTVKTKRYFAFFCTTGSNAVVVSGPRVESFKSRATSGNGTSYTCDEGEVMQNLMVSGFDVQRAQTIFSAYNVKLKGTEESAFEESSKMDEGSGGSTKTVAIGADDIAALAGDPPEQGKPTAAGEAFKFDCPEFEVVSNGDVSLVPHEAIDGGDDLVFSFTCAPLVTGPPHHAYKYRITKFFTAEELTEQSGCTKDEALAGVHSFVDEGVKKRYFSLVCFDGSNAKLTETEERQDHELSASRALFESEGLIVKNFWFFKEGETSNLGVDLVAYELLPYAETRFTDCSRTEEATGKMTPIEDCGGEDIPPEPTTTTTTTTPEPPPPPGIDFCALQNGDCPSDFLSNPDCPARFGCFKVVEYEAEEEKKSWFEAQEACAELGEGGVLAQFYVKDQLSFISDEIGRNGKRYWIGLHRESNSDFSQWPDGTEMTFKSWAYGRARVGRGNQACGKLRNGRWLDDVCSSTWNEGFICQIP